MSEFDETATVPALEQDKRIKISPWHRALTKKRSMRLLVGLPVVYTALVLYVGMFCTIIFGWADVETVKDIAVLLAVPGTLAATIVGFFFGGKSAK